MKVTLTKTTKIDFEVAGVEALAEVLYWEDSEVNGVEDTEGDLIPFREDDFWHVKIDLLTGKVKDWPEGTSAKIHYKVCDQGKYWLLNADGNRIAKYYSEYVPSLMCWGGAGYGDYVIMNISEDGTIQKFYSPEINPEQWVVLDEESANG